MTERNTTWMIWPDGTMAELHEIQAGDYDWMSDDYMLASDLEVAEYFEELDNEIDALCIQEGIPVPPRTPIFKLNS